MAYATRVLGTVRIDGLPADLASKTASKYWLETAAYQHCMRQGIPHWGERYERYAMVTGDGALWLQPHCQHARDWDLPYPPIRHFGIRYPVPPEKLGLRDYQQDALKQWAATPYGILQARAGSGKTVIGCGLFAYHGVRSLVVVPTRDLLNQWHARCQQFLGIDAGRFGSGHGGLGEQVTIATYQTLSKHLCILDEHDLILVDEGHRCPAPTIRSILAHFAGPYRYGCTATPWRADGLHKALDWMLGGVTTTVSAEATAAHVLPLTILQDKTDIEFPEDEHTQFQSRVARHFRRNAVLANRISACVQKKHRVIALSQRVEQLSAISGYLKSADIPHVVITGSTPKKQRVAALKSVEDGSVSVLLATYQLAAEGLDIPALSALVMLAPLGNPTRVEQACGRIARPCPGKGEPVVYDYVDEGGIAGALARKRLGVYRKLGYRVSQ